MILANLLKGVKEIMEPFIKFIKRKNKEFKEKRTLVRTKDIGGKGYRIWEREKWTWMQQTNLKQKAFLIERLRLADIKGRVSYRRIKEGAIEYRIGYYIVGKNGSRKGQWTWGQFCPLIPRHDLNKLFKKAKRDGVILD